MSLDRPQSDLSRRLEEAERALRARNFELTVLHELSGRIGDSLTYEELFRSILTHLEKGVAFDVAAGLILSEVDGNRLYLRSSRALTAPVVAEVETRLLRACQRLGESLVRREVVRVTAPDGAAAGPPLETLGSFFQVPIIAGSRTAGILLVGSEAAGQFTEDHLRLLYTVAGQAAAAVQRMQDHLGVERRRLRSVVERLPGGVVLLDARRRVALANPAGEKFLGELGGIGVGDVLEHLGGVPFDDLERRSPLDIVTERPRRRVTLATVVPLEPGSAEPWLVVLEDATDARESVRRRDRFLAMLSHELRNPLAALSNATYLLRMPGADDRAREEAVNVVDRQIRHTTRLVDDLLDVSRFLHGKIHVRKQPLDLALIVSEAAVAQRPAFERDGIALAVNVEPGPIRVAGDAARLVQVVDNLLNNARKFTPAGKMVGVSCGQEGGDAVIKVSDHGIGIPLEKQATIFEPFMQVEQGANDSSTGGLGLGLALVKIMAKLHGGSVSVQSDGSGRGAEFVVKLPLLVGRGAEPDGPAAPRAAGVPRKILVIEDQRDVREMFRRLLQNWGHEVGVAETGPAGVSAFREQQPDIAFIDIGLPGMDGFHVGRAIRRLPGGAVAVLVALTGHAMPEDRKRALEAGFDEHMAKPVDLARLEEMLGDCRRPSEGSPQAAHGQISA